MFLNYSNSPSVPNKTPEKTGGKLDSRKIPAITDLKPGSGEVLCKSSLWNKWWLILILPGWVFVGFFVAQSLIGGLIQLLMILHVPITLLSQSVASTLITALVYIITLVLVVGLPWVTKIQRTSKSEIGLTRLPTWTDILITPAGLIIYLILSVTLMTLLAHFFPGIDINQVQDVGFKHLNQRYEYILAFTTLVIVAPVAEEILFRGYLFGKLKKFFPVWAAILITSTLFGAIHGSWSLAIDTFALSIILCLLREITGNIWASILLHIVKNGIAYYVLFINPLLLVTLGR